MRRLVKSSPFYYIANLWIAQLFYCTLKPIKRQSSLSEATAQWMLCPESMPPGLHRPSLSTIQAAATKLRFILHRGHGTLHSPYQMEKSIDYLPSSRPLHSSDSPTGPLFSSTGKPLRIFQTQPPLPSNTTLPITLAHWYPGPRSLPP